MAVLSDAQREAGWTVVKLGDITTKIGSGSTPRGGKSSYVDEGPMVIRSQNVLDNELDLSDVARVPEELTVKLKGVLVQKGDTLLNITGSGNTTIGRSALVHEDLGEAYVNQHVCIIRPNKSQVNEIFLQKSIFAFKDELLGLSYGSTRDALTKGIIESFEIPLPPLEEQERIAGILGSLDDKIEANTRLIQTMEDYVHTMIKKISKSDSVKRVAIKDLAVHEKNQELPREHVDGVIHHYSLPAYDSGKTPGLEEANSIKSNKFIIDKPCVLFSKLNPGTPRIWLVNPEEGVKSYASTEFIVLTPKENVDIANLWATCSEERISQNLADMASGTSTSHQRVRPTDILNSKILDLSNQSEIRSITSYIEALRKENLQLAETRDALIKRLIG